MLVLFLLIYQYCFAHHDFVFKPKHVLYYVQIIFFGVYLTYILRFIGLASLSSAKTAFLFNVAPFFAALYSYISFKEKLTRQQWFGLFIGFIGLFPILLSSSKAEQRWGELFFISWPELAVLAAVACHNYSWIIMRKLVREKNYAPSMVNGLTMFVGGIMALITAYFAEGSQTMGDPGAFFEFINLGDINKQYHLPQFICASFAQIFGNLFGICRIFRTLIFSILWMAFAWRSYNLALLSLSTNCLCWALFILSA